MDQRLKHQNDSFDDVFSLNNKKNLRFNLYFGRFCSLKMISERIHHKKDLFDVLNVDPSTISHKTLNKKKCQKKFKKFKS